jgi:hypothetical protein
MDRGDRARDLGAPGARGVEEVIAFLRSRPTETWLGLWAAIVAVLVAAGVEIPDTVVAAVSAVIGWAVTWLASQPGNSLGPVTGE